MDAPPEYSEQGLPPPSQPQNSDPTPNTSSNAPPPNYSFYQELTTATQNLTNPPVRPDSSITLKPWKYAWNDCLLNKKSLICSSFCPCYSFKKVYEKVYEKESRNCSNPTCCGIIYGTVQCGCIALSQQQIHFCIECSASSSLGHSEMVKCCIACVVLPPSLVTSWACYACMLASLVHTVAQDGHFWSN